MKNWKPTLLVAAAALSLQACDVSVHEKPADQTASTSVTTTESTTVAAPASAPDTGTNVASSASPQPATPATETPAAGASAPIAEVPVAGSSAPAAEAPAASASAQSDTMAAAQQQPDTNAMGATAPGSGNTMAANTSSDGVAAPTELARFFQDNPIAGKSGSAQADGKGRKTKS